MGSVASPRTGGSVMAMNMAHCRFENTLIALRECDNAASEAGDFIKEELSEREYHAFVQLVNRCRTFADTYESDLP
jgi:hypothetical protein